jgi:hypothetical protein
LDPRCPASTPDQRRRPLGARGLATARPTGAALAAHHRTDVDRESYEISNGMAPVNSERNGV